jgi:hypothetical protein
LAPPKLRGSATCFDRVCSVFRLRGRFAQEGGDVVGEAGWWAFVLVATMRASVVARAVTLALATIWTPIWGAFGRTCIPAWLGTALRAITVWFTNWVWFTSWGVTARVLTWGLLAGGLNTWGAFAWSGVASPISPAVTVMLAWWNAAWHRTIANWAIRRQAWPTRNVRLVADGTAC